MSTSILEFEKAVTRLEEALLEEKNDFLRDSVIQRFEFSVELAWKTSKKVMGTNISAPKDVIREMARGAYINDVDIWLKAIDMRNLSSHTYKESLAEQVYYFAQSFLPQLKQLLEKVKEK
ncbi:MAG: HI0074 family nucleotidyltransferase substrate-binding subunit [Bdellovibrionales bacterium]